METGREFRGRSLEEALARASAELGSRPSELRYEVVEDGRRGFLGFGTRPVKIRLLGAGLEETKGTPTPARSGQEPGGPGPLRSGEKQGAPGPLRDSGAHGLEQGARVRAGSRGGRRLDAPPAGARKVQDAARQERPDARGPKGALPSKDDVPYSRHVAVRSAAGRILGEMGLELTASLHDREEIVVLELGGLDARLLLENDGEPLEAFQHVLNKILFRDERFGTRVVVDCEGFRQRHDERLIERARKASEQATRTGKPVHIDGLNAYERRLTHLALADEKGIKTYSTGDGAIKRLTIEPAGDSPASASDSAESPSADER